MNELKPCPFCGGEAQVNTWTMHGITESRCFCPNSDCPNSVRTVALEQWNTRPIEDALTARIAELEGDVTRLLTESDDAHMAEARYIAKDELAKKDTRIAELEAERRWIPVSERLPEETGLYLVWQDGSFAVGYRVLYYSAGRSYLDFMWSIVTHWMPLPARPEVQE